MSVLRAVTTPSKGASTRLKDSNSFNRATFCCAESAEARLAAASPALSSASCFETDCVLSKSCQR